MENAADPQPFGDLDEHRGVFDKDDLPRRLLREVQRQPEDVRVRLADVDKAGGNKK
jgi:hypothetical protein